MQFLSYPTGLYNYVKTMKDVIITGITVIKRSL